MKRLISIALTATLALVLAIPATAVTTGKWDFSGIHDTIQNVAETQEPESGTERPPISDKILEQLYAAQRAQYRAATEFWNKHGS